MKICDLCNARIDDNSKYLFLKSNYKLDDCLKVDLCTKCFYQVRNDIVKKLGWESDE